MLDLDLKADQAETPAPEITAKEAEMLIYAEKLAHVMDGLIPIPGTSFRVGLDGLMGLTPFIGDGVTSVAPLSLVALAIKAELPKSIITKMLFNIGRDFLIGLIPVLGDLADFGIKANRKNLWILQDHFNRPRTQTK